MLFYFTIVFGIFDLSYMKYALFILQVKRTRIVLLKLSYIENIKTWLIGAEIHLIKPNDKEQLNQCIFSVQIHRVFLLRIVVLFRTQTRCFIFSIFSYFSRTRYYDRSLRYVTDGRR